MCKIGYGKKYFMKNKVFFRNNNQCERVGEYELGVLGGWGYLTK